MSAQADATSSSICLLHRPQLAGRPAVRTEDYAALRVLSANPTLSPRRYTGRGTGGLRLRSALAVCACGLRLRAAPTEPVADGEIC